MNKIISSLLVVLLTISISYAQERMIVKPGGFDYTKIKKVPEVNVPVSQKTRVIIPCHLMVAIMQVVYISIR
jgi:hypothetical protein